MDRRNFVKVLGAAGGSLVGLEKLRAEGTSSSKETCGILIDTTRCVGCKTCEEMCASAHGLPAPDLDTTPDPEQQGKTSEKQWTVVGQYATPAGEIYRKTQCMHCIQPACASACLTKAMLKTEEGPVQWRESKCMGCRFCMVSCPFDIPKFEYNSSVPKIQKCQLCWDRLQEGKTPVCVENCPAEALQFGKRSELIVEARRRIYQEPDKYIDHIYGEHEVGGTSVLYLSSVPFEQLGLRTDLGNRPYPELTKEFLYGVPVVLLLWPAFLLALNNATKRENQETHIEGYHER